MIVKFLVLFSLLALSLNAMEHTMEVGDLIEKTLTNIYTKAQENLQNNNAENTDDEIDAIHNQRLVEMFMNEDNQRTKKRKRRQNTEHETMELVELIEDDKRTESQYGKYRCMICFDSIPLNYNERLVHLGKEADAMMLITDASNNKFHAKCVDVWVEQEPLIDAIIAQDTKEIETIIRNRPESVNKSVNGSWRPLMVAALLGDYFIVNWLLQQKAILTHQRKDGFTALMIAVSENHMDIVERLVDEGKISIAQKTTKGSTALDIALSQKNRSMIEFLMKQN